MRTHTHSDTHTRAHTRTRTGETTIVALGGSTVAADEAAYVSDCAAAPAEALRGAKAVRTRLSGYLARAGAARASQLAAAEEQAEEGAAQNASESYIGVQVAYSGAEWTQKLAQNALHAVMQVTATTVRT
jgi:hypothetical protein